MFFVMNAILYRGLAALLVFFISAAPAPAQQRSTRIWRVCLSDAKAPPYVYNDANHPGLVERIVVAAGQQVGFDTIFIRYPSARCREMMAAGEIDAQLAASSSTNLKIFRFPMKNGALDVERRIAQVNLVWVKRSGTHYEWNGSAMVGRKPGEILVGTRLTMKAAVDPLRAMGFKLDPTALTARHALLKLERQRVDLAVALQEEVELLLQDPQLRGLVVLPKSLASPMYFLAVSPSLPPDLQAQVEAWWTAIGHLRQLPEYRVS